MSKPLLFASGVAVLLLTWFGPLPKAVPTSFSAHMLMHVSIVAVVAPLLALGVAGTRFDCVDRAPRLFMPIPASIVELIFVWGWHVPALHRFARTTSLGLTLEQLMFLASAFVVWLAAFGGSPRASHSSRRSRRGLGIIALLLTFMHMTLLGALLALPMRPLYGTSSLVTPEELLHDQHCGGAIMLLAGSVSYLAGGLWLAFLLLGRKEMGK